ncbi:MAG: FAD/FMN-containing dehydrogenase [Gammaproteobacteria bacterium]|jgi:FAD/FMN-containing dehydrogenase
MNTSNNHQEFPENLDPAFSGPIIRPGDDSYESARRVHNGMIDKRPRIILQCLSTADVCEALRYGIAKDLEIAVRGGGHNVAGRAVCDNGLVIDLSLMKGMFTDTQSRVVRVQPGVTWGELNRETELHGLATTGGMISSTGVAGLTLGGGLGALMPKYGLTIDNLRSAQVVTVSHGILNASEQENTDLFWAIRGGGGNFGIVTSFEFNVHSVGPIVQGGLSLYPEDEIHSLLKYYRQRMSNAPDELSLLTVIRHIPEQLGTLCAALFVCHCGDEQSSTEEIQKLNQFGNPIMNTLGPISYSELNTLVDSSFPKLALNYWKSSYIKELTNEAIECLVERFKVCPSDMSRIIIDHFHGAAIRPAPSSTAYPNRSEGFYILIISQWMDESDTKKNIEWTRKTYEALSPYMDSGVYSNYMSDDETEARVHSSFGDNYPRLQKIKAEYDPQNRLRGNQNITPVI